MLPADFGLMRVRVGTGPAVRLALLDVVEARDELGRRHPGDDLAVCRGLAAWLAGKGLAVTPLGADRVARHAAAELDRLARGPGFREAALTRFYGINAFDPADDPAAVRLALHVNRPALEALDALHRGVSDDRLYDVVLAATGSEEEAADAYADRLAASIRTTRRGGP